MSITTSQQRIEFRVSADLKQQLEQAAAAAGLTVAAFVKDVAVRSARQIIREQHQLQLDSESWTKFIAAVDRPGQVVPGLAELLDRPSIFTQS